MPRRYAFLVQTLAEAFRCESPLLFDIETALGSLNSQSSATAEIGGFTRQGGRTAPGDRPVNLEVVIRAKIRRLIEIQANFLASHIFGFGCEEQARSRSRHTLPSNQDHSVEGPIVDDMML